MAVTHPRKGEEREMRWLAQPNTNSDKVFTDSKNTETGPLDPVPEPTLMDLFTVLCKEIEDDTLVAAVVISLFQNGQVRFQEDRSGEKIIFEQPALPLTSSESTFA